MARFMHLAKGMYLIETTNLQDPIFVESDPSTILEFDMSTFEDLTDCVIELDFSEMIQGDEGYFIIEQIIDEDEGVDFGADSDIEVEISVTYDDMSDEDILELEDQQEQIGKKILELVELSDMIDQQLGRSKTDYMMVSELNDLEITNFNDSFADKIIAISIE